MPIGFATNEDFQRTSRVVRDVERWKAARQRHNQHRRYFLPQIFPFELTADLTSGSSATARSLEWDADANTYGMVGDAFTVYDDLYNSGIDMPDVNSGDRGTFFFVEPDYRVILTLDTPPRISFTILTSCTEDAGSGLIINGRTIHFDGVGHYTSIDAEATACTINLNPP